MRVESDDRSGRIPFTLALALTLKRLRHNARQRVSQLTVELRFIGVVLLGEGTLDTVLRDQLSRHLRVEGCIAPRSARAGCREILCTLLTRPSAPFPLPAGPLAEPPPPARGRPPRNVVVHRA